MNKQDLKHLCSNLRSALSKYSLVRDLFVFIIIVSVIFAWQTRDMLNTDGEVIIPQRNLVSLEGEVVPLLAGDKTNLVYFFAPWCTICDLSIDNLSFLNTDKINVVVIALDYTSKEEVKDFIEKNEVTASVLMGNESLKKEFAIVGYPSYYLIDTKFSVQSKSYGYSTAIGLKLRELYGN